jgi:hypothetical protein
MKMKNRNITKAEELIGNIYTSMILLVNHWQEHSNDKQMDDVLTNQYPFGVDLWELSAEVGAWMSDIAKQHEQLFMTDTILKLALGTFLSDYPSNCSGQDILDAMKEDKTKVENGNCEILVWIPFETWSLSDLAEEVESLYASMVLIYNRGKEAK